ncbi:unnamed protein product [Rotaria sp. Silwood1]|nr:unnamed protein product [Rotaria sp. Silwood1]
MPIAAIGIIQVSSFSLLFATQHLYENSCLDKHWLYPQYHDNERTKIKKPDELERVMEDPPENVNKTILDRIQGSMVGMALGDALGAPVEFRPPEYFFTNPVTDLQGGGTWRLNKGQFTDDTSMALCLASSLIARRGFVPYDQLARYKWWYNNGYMSSIGKCFDIGMATCDSLLEFQRRQRNFAEKYKIPLEQLDFLSDFDLLEKFNVYCSESGVAGNGALMRLAPVPLFFYRQPIAAVEFSGCSGQITHGDQKAYDACRYYGALIVATLQDESKDNLLSEKFYQTHISWFGNQRLHKDIQMISEGSFKRSGGLMDGIRGQGYIVNALEAALWAFWSDENSFEKGALSAVNLGDDTDTTAAIYGQLAGAYYTYKNLPKKWLDHVYARNFIQCLSKWITYEGSKWNSEHVSSATKKETK